MGHKITKEDRDVVVSVLFRLSNGCIVQQRSESIDSSYRYKESWGNASGINSKSENQTMKRQKITKNDRK